MSDLVQEKQGQQFDLITWFEINKRPVVAGLALIVLAIAGTIIWKSQRQARLENASAALLTVTSTHKQNIPVAELDKVIQSHPGTSAAAQANLLAGKEFFEQGKYAEARARFDAVTSARASDDVIAAAQYGLAACLDAENKLPEALAAYQRVADYPGGKYLASLARLSMARIQESQGKPKEALSLYDAILRVPNSAAAQEASQLRSALLRTHPELVPAPVPVTNSAPVITPQVTPAAPN